MNPPRKAFYAWAVVAMLVPIALLNYLDRMMVATMRTSIRADIPTIANDADFGFLMALFMWVYAFLSPIGGYLADRFNRRWMVILSLFVWSLTTWLTGHAHSFGEMAWTRALMGVSEAFYIPAALALIADFHPGPTRSRAVGFHMCGIYAGQALGGLGGYIADTSSWRNAFYWFGAAGILYAVLLVFVLRDPRPQTEVGPAQRDVVSIRGSTKALPGTGAFLILVVYFTLPGIPGWAIKNWLPTFLGTKFNLKQGPAGLSATGYVTLACFFGALLGGALADRAMRRTPRGRIYVSAMGMGLCVPALIGLGNVGSMNSAIACMLLFGLGFGFFDANNMPILCQIVRPENRATGYGIMNLVGVAAGAGITVLMGALRDRGISLGVVFSICAAAALLGGLLILLVRPRPDEAPTISAGPTMKALTNPPENKLMVPNS
jgi:MFS transporter, Spinster family, sphingosine-1-phosphate transporter